MSNVDEIEAWMNTLKVGDKVKLYQNRIFWHEGTVEKVTKTQVLVRGRKFRKKDGWEIKHGFSADMLMYLKAE